MTQEGIAPSDAQGHNIDMLSIGGDMQSGRLKCLSNKSFSAGAHEPATIAWKRSSI